MLGWLTQLESAVDGWLETLQEGEAEGQPCMFGIALSECLSELCDGGSRVECLGVGIRERPAGRYPSRNLLETTHPGWRVR